MSSSRDGPLVPCRAPCSRAQVLFKQQLARNQWQAIFLLTAGVIVKQVKFDQLGAGEGMGSFFGLGLLLILVYVCAVCYVALCLTLAAKPRARPSPASTMSIFSRLVYRHDGRPIDASQGKMGDVPVMVQNVFMYTDSIVCNSLVLLYSGNLFTALSGDNIEFALLMLPHGISLWFSSFAILHEQSRSSLVSRQILQWKVMGIIAVSVSGGIVTSLLLKVRYVVLLISFARKLLSHAIFVHAC